MIRSLAIAAGLSAFALSAAPALAHHSGAMFDRSKEVTIAGTVKDFQWTNPHSSFQVLVPQTDGSQQEWSVEMNGPNNLIRQGWKRSTIKPGDKVSVTINPLRDGKPGGWYVGISLPNGQKLRTDEPPTGGTPASS